MKNTLFAFCVVSLSLLSFQSVLRADARDGTESIDEIKGFDMGGPRRTREDFRIYYENEGSNYYNPYGTTTRMPRADGYPYETSGPTAQEYWNWENNGLTPAEKKRIPVYNPPGP
jgi:hypothetical protein